MKALLLALCMLGTGCGFSLPRLAPRPSPFAGGFDPFPSSDLGPETEHRPPGTYRERDLPRKEQAKPWLRNRPPMGALVQP